MRYISIPPPRATLTLSKYDTLCALDLFVGFQSFHEGAIQNDQ